MSEQVFGTIVNYRFGFNDQMPKWCLIELQGANSISASGQLVGRKVFLKYGKNEFIGKIMGLHGNRGVIKAKFRKGVPGAAIGATVEIKG